MRFWNILHLSIVSLVRFYSHPGVIDKALSKDEQDFWQYLAVSQWDNVGSVQSTGVLSAVLNGDPEVFGNSVVIPGFSAVHCPPKCSSCPFYVCRRTYSNVSCQLGIIPGSGRRHGQETRSNRPISS